jgi:hypothetical protein
VAQFELNGIPAERRAVTTFAPPRPTLPRPRGLRVKRRQGKLLISWAKVPGATRYELAATSGIGFQRFASTGKHGFVMARIPPSAGGSVTVRALDRIRQSVTARARFRRLARPARKLKPLRRCHVAKRKVSCRKH